MTRWSEMNSQVLLGGLGEGELILIAAIAIPLVVASRLTGTCSPPLS
jgi:hypothetical protein